MIEIYILLLFVLFLLSCYIWFYFSWRRIYKIACQCSESITRLKKSLAELVESSTRVDAEFGKILKDLDDENSRKEH